MNAAKPMLMRAGWRVGASANDDQKTGWNISSLIGGISRLGRLRKLEFKVKIYDLWQDPMEYGEKRRMEKSLLNEALTTLFYAGFL